MFLFFLLRMHPSTLATDQMALSSNQFFIGLWLSVGKTWNLFVLSWHILVELLPSKEVSIGGVQFVYPPLLCRWWDRQACLTRLSRMWV